MVYKQGDAITGRPACFFMSGYFHAARRTKMPVAEEMFKKNREFEKSSSEPRRFLFKK